QPLHALGEQHPVAETNERLRAVCAEPLPATRRSEDGPRTHLAPAVAFFFAAGFFAGAFFAGALVAVFVTSFTVVFAAAVFCVPPPVSALTTTLTMSSPITFRSPTFSAFSEGTLTVISLCRILIVRYSRFSPRISRFSFFTTVPAPWCGYTTLSPTLYKPAPFRPM